MISEFPLFVFTLLGGMGAGAYLFTAFLPRRDSDKPWLFPAIVLLLLAISGVALLGHLGKPAGMFNAFTNPTSGITLEGFTSMIFGLLVVVDLVLAWQKKDVAIVRVLAAIAGLLLMCAMGYTYYTFIGMPQWGTVECFPLFVLGGIATGATLAAFFVQDEYRNAGLAVGAIAALAANAVAILAEGAHFAAVGIDVTPFVCGAALVAIAAGVALFGRKSDASWVLPCAIALALIGTAVARYAFYLI